VDVVSDAATGKRAAEVTIELVDGTSLTCRITDNKGTPNNPMSDEDLGGKFIDNVGPVLGADRATALAAACWAADDADDFAALVRMTGKPS
jgi:hypothetical protein